MIDGYRHYLLTMEKRRMEYNTRIWHIKKLGWGDYKVGFNKRKKSHFFWFYIIFDIFTYTDISKHKTHLHTLNTK